MILCNLFLFCFIRFLHLFFLFHWFVLFLLFLGFRKIFLFEELALAENINNDKCDYYDNYRYNNCGSNFPTIWFFGFMWILYWVSIYVPRILTDFVCKCLLEGIRGVNDRTTGITFGWLNLNSALIFFTGYTLIVLKLGIVGAELLELDILLSDIKRGVPSAIHCW